MAILTMLILPIQEHGLSFHLNYCQFPLSMFSSFQHINLSPPWYFISGVVILKAIISLHLHPFSDISLLVQRNATYFCNQVTFTFLKLVINSSTFVWCLQGALYVVGFLYVVWYLQGFLYIVPYHLHIMTIFPLPEGIHL